MKVERHSKIVELIGKYEIETQEELAERPSSRKYSELMTMRATHSAMMSRAVTSAIVG